MLPAEGRTHFFKKYEKIVYVVKNWTKKQQDGGCNAYVGDLGPLARGRMQFYPSESNKKKVATHNENLRGATKEPPGSHQGSGRDPIFGSNGPRETQYL